MTKTDVKYYDENLTPLLLGASQEELDPIVQLIVKHGGISNSLTRNTDYKIHSPNHTKYAYAINDEIILYGSTTLGTAKLYIDIVRLVAKQLKIDFKKEDNIEQIEKAILTDIINKLFNETTLAEKEKLFPLMCKYIVEYRNPLHFHFMQNPLALVYGLLKKTISPAYEVCVPVVVCLAALRMDKKIEEHITCECGTVLNKAMKFCHECGSKI